MRDDEGRIRVAGFYDGGRPVTAAERARDRRVAAPGLRAARRARARPHRGRRRSLAESIMRPALNLRGIRGGAVGAQGGERRRARGARRRSTSASCPNQTPARVREKVVAHSAGSATTSSPTSPTRRRGARTRASSALDYREARLRRLTHPARTRPCGAPSSASSPTRSGAPLEVADARRAASRCTSSRGRTARRWSCCRSPTTTTPARREREPAHPQPVGRHRRRTRRCSRGWAAGVREPVAAAGDELRGCGLRVRGFGARSA